ncbi:hypothetical protein [Streptomyces cupreus]|nr:hypothetical protein [Streptomyces cupreus]
MERAPPGSSQGIRRWADKGRQGADGTVGVLPYRSRWEVGYTG